MAGLIPFGHRHGISRGFDDLGFRDGSFMRSFFNGSDRFTNFKKDGVLKIVLPKSGEEKKKSKKKSISGDTKKPAPLCSAGFLLYNGRHAL